jgi:hypothetical protein
MFDSGASWQVPPEWIIKHPWRQVFAWRPVNINGKSKWLTKVWRRRIETWSDPDDLRVYEYGTVFDVIRDDK